MATRAPFARSSTGCSTSRVPCLRMELCSTIHSRRQRKQLRDTGLRRRRAWANLCVADHRRNDCKRMTKGRRVKADRRQGAAWPALCKTCPTACSRLRTSIQRHHILAVELLGIKCEICTKKHLQKGGESDACCRRVWLASCGQASEKPQQKPALSECNKVREQRMQLLGQPHQYLRIAPRSRPARQAKVRAHHALIAVIIGLR